MGQPMNHVGRLLIVEQDLLPKAMGHQLMQNVERGFAVIVIRIPQLRQVNFAIGRTI